MSSCYIKWWFSWKLGHFKIFISKLDLHEKEFRIICKLNNSYIHVENVSHKDFLMINIWYCNLIVLMSTQSYNNIIQQKTLLRFRSICDLLWLLIFLCKKKMFHSQKKLCYIDFVLKNCLSPKTHHLFELKILSVFTTHVQLVLLSLFW